MEKLLNNSEWVQTVWVLGSRCSDGWFSLKFWLHNVSAHHNWRSFLSILMFRRENRKHIGLFWSYKFIRYFFFSAGAVCVSLNGKRNVLVYSNSDLAPNDLLERKKERHFYFTIYSYLFKVSPHSALFAQKLVSWPSSRSRRRLRLYATLQMMKSTLTFPNPAAN